MNAEALADFLENENIEYRQNEPMRAHTTFKIGGEADIFIIPASPAALIYAVKKCNHYLLRGLNLPTEYRERRAARCI